MTKRMFGKTLKTAEKFGVVIPCKFIPDRLDFTQWHFQLHVSNKVLI